MTIEERVLQMEQFLARFGYAPAISDPVTGVRPAEPVPVPTPAPTAPAPLPTGGREGAVGPSTTTGRPGEAVAPAGADYAFDWGQVGHPEPFDFQAGVRASFRTIVPAGYRGALAFAVVGLVNAFTSMDVEFWCSASPDGEPIAGTHYKGSWIAQTLGADGEFKFAPAAGPYWFNVVAGVSQRFGVEQIHQ